MDECSAEDPPHVGNDLVYAECFWAAENPDLSMPMDKLGARTTADTEELTVADVPLTDGDTPDNPDSDHPTSGRAGRQDEDGAPA